MYINNDKNIKNKQTIPYTYTITFLKTGQIYYGVRFASGCHPAELGIKYFSSSNVIKRLIKEYGLKTFKFDVKKIFSDAQTARNYETKVLRRLKVKENPNFLNKHDNTYLKCYDHAGEKNPMFGKPAPNKGKKHKPETIQKMKNSHNKNPTWLGKHLSDSHKQNIAKNQIGAKHKKFKGLYHTPFGIFESSRLANHPLISYKAIQEWCKRSDKIISSRRVSKSPYLNKSHIGKTFKEIGFWFENIILL